jgi:hypothetical protein
METEVLPLKITKRKPYSRRQKVGEALIRVPWQLKRKVK